MKVDQNVKNSLRLFDFNLLCYVLIVDCLFSIVIKNGYERLSSIIINYFDLSIATVMRPWLLFKNNFLLACLFYSLFLFFLSMLVGQVTLLVMGLDYSKKQPIRLKNWRGISHEFKKKLTAPYRKRLVGLTLACLPFSNAILMQDYFTSFRLSEAVWFPLTASTNLIRFGSGLMILLWLGLSFWAISQFNKKQVKRSSFLVKMIVLAFIELIVYLVVGLIVTLITSHLTDMGLQFGAILMKALRFFMGLFWLACLVSPGISRQSLDVSNVPWWCKLSSIILLIGLAWTPAPLAGPFAPQWLAHKGLSHKNGVENSIAVLQRTARQRPDYVEMDVRQTRDHHFVVIHDHTLKRLTQQSGTVEAKSLKTLLNYQVNQAGQSAKLVDFSQYLKVAHQQHQRLLVELKSAPGIDTKDMGRRFMSHYGAALKAHGDLIHTTDANLVATIKKVEPEQKVGYILPVSIWGIPQTSADFFSIEGSAYDLQHATEIKNKHKKVYIWTINGPLQVSQSILKHPNGVISDNFFDLKKVMKSTNVKWLILGAKLAYVTAVNPYVPMD